MTALEIHPLPVISTGHLTKEVAERLDAEGDSNPWCPVATWEYGYFIFLDDLFAVLEEPPQCLVDIRNWRMELEKRGVVDNSRWLRLDGDGSRVEELPYYEW